MKFKTETSAGGIVYKKAGNKIVWLIGQHSSHKGWVFLKGLVGDKIRNEPMDKAAIREVEEEGGIKAKITNPKPVKVGYTYKWQNTVIKKTVYYFLMEYVSGDPKNHDWEMSDVKFMAEDDVKKILTYKSDKDAFEKILSLFPAE